MLILFLLEGLDFVSAIMESIAVMIESELKDQGVLSFSSQFYRFSFPSSFVYIALALSIGITLVDSHLPILIVFFPIDSSTLKETKNNHVNVSISFILTFILFFRPSSYVLYPYQRRTLMELAF